MITHKKKFGIYHWDTFDNETILIDEADTVQKAKDYISEHYGSRISPNGADRVEIVNQKGTIIESFHVC